MNESKPNVNRNTRKYISCLKITLWVQLMKISDFIIACHTLSQFLSLIVEMILKFVKPGIGERFSTCHTLWWFFQKMPKKSTCSLFVEREILNRDS